MALEAACADFCQRVNARPHAETRRPPLQMLAEERARLHLLPTEPYTAALGETRLVRDDQTIRWGSVRYSTPKGHVGTEVWCRVAGAELVIVARTGAGLAEIARHELSTPGHPRIADEHYPDHPAGNGPHERPLRPADDAERAFLALGDGAERWLREACSTGVSRIRTKMANALELAAWFGTAPVDRALGMAALAGRFAEGDLASITEHLDRAEPAESLVVADPVHSAQPGPGAWEGLGR